MKRQKSIINYLLPTGVFVFILLIWQLICSLGIVPSLLLPSPLEVCSALISDIDNLSRNALYTLSETFVGMAITIVLSFMLACFMDKISLIKTALYPLLVVTQTIPSIAIAPLLVIWFGYDMLPKIILIVIVCFFPLAIGFLDGFASADEDEIRLLRSMGASDLQIFWHLKLPKAMPHFFSGLKISSSYCIVSAVISEWVGGSKGLGVYMMRVKNNYDYDKMFAVIFVISALSILLMAFISLLEKKIMPYKTKEENE